MCRLPLGWGLVMTSTRVNLLGLKPLGRLTDIISAKISSDQLTHVRVRRRAQRFCVRALCHAAGRAFNGSTAGSASRGLSVL